MARFPIWRPIYGLLVCVRCGPRRLRPGSCEDRVIPGRYVINQAEFLPVKGVSRALTGFYSF